MCGILAIISKLSNAASQASLGLEVLSHRGPDGKDIWTSADGTVAMGHCRLAVRGSDSDSQPIVNETGQVVISVNGEFYETENLRNMLVGRGHHFRSTSDSELAIHLYEEFGINFLDYLRGEFAILLWDSAKRQLVAARDRFGIKPLCYCRKSNGNVMFASEAKAIFAAGFSQPDWDMESGWHSLAHQYLPPQRTLFCGIQNIGPAQVLTQSIGKEPVIHTYWQPEFSEQNVTGKDILDLLGESVRMRLEANRPPAFSLSGGIDSTAVVALAARETGALVPAFSVSFYDGGEYDELPQVNETASEVGAELYPILVSRVDMVAELSDATYYSEGLAINSQLVGKYLLSRAIRDAGHNTVLSGEGADEAFLGYAHLQMDSGELSNSRGLNRQAGVMLPADTDTNHLGEPPNGLARWPAFLQAKIAIGRKYSPLLNEDLVADFDQMNRVNQWIADLLPDPKTGISFPKQSAWLWSRSALSGYILRTLADGTEMAHSVEGRLPFLDHKLFELAAQIKTESNLPQGTTKQVLRNALRGVVPEEIRTRPKHPFLAPPLLAEPCPVAVIDFIGDTLTGPSFGKVPFFNQAKTIKWFDSLRKSTIEEKRDNDPILMTLLSCAMIQERFAL